MNKKKLTIYDIAKEAGVSPSTVATVLNGSWRKRRVSEATAHSIEAIAQGNGYTINLLARGLSSSKSGLIGMVIPMLDNRFFSSLAQAFEDRVRADGFYPVVASTSREPEKERSTVDALISHSIDALIIAGATDPDRLSDICWRAGVSHINVDLAGKKGVSVVSDNYKGAHDLALYIGRAAACKLARPYACFIGGRPEDDNTQKRIEGFKDGMAETGIRLTKGSIRPTGYEAYLAERTIRELHAEIGRLPDVLFVNSTIAFEGVVRFLKGLPIEVVLNCSIGCFDYDPFIELLHFPVAMVRQNTRGLIDESFRRLEMAQSARRKVVLIPTELILPGAHPDGERLGHESLPSTTDTPSGHRTSA